MRRIVTKQNITRALRAKLPPGVLQKINFDRVLVFREKTKRWLGPYTVSQMEIKCAFIGDGKMTRPFSATQKVPFTPQRRDLELKRLLRGLAEMKSNPDIKITDVLYPSDNHA